MERVGGLCLPHQELDLARLGNRSKWALGGGCGCHTVCPLRFLSTHCGPVTPCHLSERPLVDRAHMSRSGEGVVHAAVPFLLLAPPGQGVGMAVSGGDVDGTSDLCWEGLPRG